MSGSDLDSSGALSSNVTSSSAVSTCPCGSDKVYEQCCELLHAGNLQSITPEQLMRSRYCAFVKGFFPYLIRTHHISKRKLDDEQTLKESINGLRWLGLRVITSKQEAESKAFVEFVAFYEQNDKLFQLHELSEFVKESGQWFYYQGQMKPSIKINRNDFCICGSGKKFKKCHGS